MRTVDPLCKEMLMLDELRPAMSDVSSERVLIQAWKKCSNYIRYHNWYADALELDLAAADLPELIREVSRDTGRRHWRCGPLRLVPAPKSQQWDFSSDEWLPKGGPARLRPLAHVSIRDQLVATAAMLCLADKVESLQGDPRLGFVDPGARRAVVSYGNRLFCDLEGDRLVHRWGSSKLYRSYFTDYRTFLSRPAVVAEEHVPRPGGKVVILHSDLSQFYDRVRPELLRSSVVSVLGDDVEQDFVAFIDRAMCWSWDRRDAKGAQAYGSLQGIPDFARIALPQGLVAAGFFANVVLVKFDESLKALFGQSIAKGIRLVDYCRYVDDLRLVLEVDEAACELDWVELKLVEFLNACLDETAPGLCVSEDKTVATALLGEDRPLVRQSRKMEAIQEAISGGFDALAGQEILDAVQGLLQTQKRYSDAYAEVERKWPLAPTPDVRDATVARFAAARYRYTCRALRPLLPSGLGTTGPHRRDMDGESKAARSQTLSQQELDEDVRVFALGLIEQWVLDPSNVRLLRIGLDLWPDAQVLEQVLRLLRRRMDDPSGDSGAKSVASYCLSEIFRAGATETGYVLDDEALAKDVDPERYRTALLDEAERLIQDANQLPWFLTQQVLLYLAAMGSRTEPVVRGMRDYVHLLGFLRGQVPARVSSAYFAKFAVVLRRSFLGEHKTGDALGPMLTSSRLQAVADRDPQLAFELANHAPLVCPLTRRLRVVLTLPIEDEADSLADVIRRSRPDSPIRHERSLLDFAHELVACVARGRMPSVAYPAAIRPDVDEDAGKWLSLEVVSCRLQDDKSQFVPPAWCPSEDRWRFQLGYLLRFILTGAPDFTRPVGRVEHGERVVPYRPAASHWHQRAYGMYSGQEAFGHDWLPLSDWFEGLLFALLRWPGCRSTPLSDVVDRGPEALMIAIKDRCGYLDCLAGAQSGVPMLEIEAPIPSRSAMSRPLRACVVQTVIPTAEELLADPSMSNPENRRQHRNHLAAALAAVEKVLDLRETHRGRSGRLDWLLLPELAVHPQDVRSHLVPFARRHRAIILAGLTYSPVVKGQPLVNSAVWVIPHWSEALGLRTVVRRQGKYHLAPGESELAGVGRIGSFRPVQWIVRYQWAKEGQNPLRLTASICYDATDLRLAADLRDRSDVFAIPALNRDVLTFDQMALALHYHMFQMVIVANNGHFGGSNAYVPLHGAHERQVFHLHGQPQASVAFVEIDDIEEFMNRARSDGMNPWKSPPAGYLLRQGTRP